MLLNYKSTICFILFFIIQHVSKYVSQTFSLEIKIQTKPYILNSKSKFLILFLLLIILI